MRSWALVPATAQPEQHTAVEDAIRSTGASDLNLSPLDFLDPNQANDAGGRVKAYIKA
jgi:hypothetical protein